MPAKTFKIIADGDHLSVGSILTFSIDIFAMNVMKKTLAGEMYKENYASFFVNDDVFARLHQSRPRSITFETEETGFTSHPITLEHIQKLEETGVLFLPDEEMLTDIGNDEIINEMFGERVTNLNPPEIYSFARDVGVTDQIEDEMRECIEDLEYRSASLVECEHYEKLFNELVAEKQEQKDNAPS